MQDATHMGTTKITRKQVFMKRGKRGQWVVWVDTKHGGRWEGINCLIADTNPVKIEKLEQKESELY